MKTKHNEEFVLQAIIAGDLEIDAQGRIWRIRKRGWDRWRQQTVSRPCRRVRAEHDCGEYLQIRVMINGRRVYALAHRLVYRISTGLPIPGELTINHKNGRKKDNHPDNLETATHSEQTLHAFRVLGLARDQRGARNAQAKLTSKKVRVIRQRRHNGERLRIIAADFGLSIQHVSKLALGQKWAHL